jgi:hypothetical protein
MRVVGVVVVVGDRSGGRVYLPDVVSAF